MQCRQSIGNSYRVKRAIGGTKHELCATFELPRFVPCQPGTHLEYQYLAGQRKPHRLRTREGGLPLQSRTLVQWYVFHQSRRRRFCGQSYSRSRGAVAHQSICPFASWFGELDVDSKFQRGEFTAGWLFSLLPGFSKRRSHAKSCELLVQWQCLPPVYRPNQSCILWAPDARVSGRLLISGWAGLAQDRRSRRCLPDHR